LSGYQELLLSAHVLGAVVWVGGSVFMLALGYDLGAPWLTVGFVGWTISFLLGAAFYPREGKRRERLIEQHGIEHEAVAGSLSRVLRVATIDTLIVVLVVLDMTTKPGL
jgi:hypothetical protein